MNAPKTYFVTPKTPDLKVPHPETGLPLNENGELVERSSYWQRRIDAGEVTVSDAQPSTSSKTNTKEANKINEDKKAQGGN